MILSTPEAQGLSCQAVLNWLEASAHAHLELHGFVLLRHGHLLSEGAWSPFTLERPHALFSVSKSFTASAVGLAVAEGLLSVDAPVLDFFPEHHPAEVTPHLKAMRVRHLLTMSTGHADDLTEAVYGAQPQPWVRTFLAQPTAHPPGTHFVYNSVATFMLAAILERVTGQGLLEYLRPRLLEPLGIRHAVWETNFEGIAVGGWGLSLSVRDIAKLGQLSLQEGAWEGRQLLPLEWVREATARQVESGQDPSSDWAQGYGYQFWRCRHGAYRADGALGQFVIVLPQQDAVLAITSAVKDMQAVLNTVWTHLLPAFQDGPLEPDPHTLQRLRQTCATLHLAPVAGQPSSPTAARVTGQTYTLEANPLGLERLHLRGLEGQAAFTLYTPQGVFSLEAAYGDWTTQDTALDLGTALDLPPPRRVALSAAWTDPDTLELVLNYLETTSVHALRLTFREGGLTVSTDPRVTLFGFTPVQFGGTLEG